MVLDSVNWLPTLLHINDCKAFLFHINITTGSATATTASCDTSLQYKVLNQSK